jgi:hypothetical protein
MESTIRYQSVTLLVPFRHDVDGVPADWCFAAMLDTVEPVTVLHAGEPDSDPSIAEFLGAQA